MVLLKIKCTYLYLIYFFIFSWKIGRNWMIELFSNGNLEGEIIGFVARAKIPIWVLGWMRFLEVKILLLLLPFSDFFCSFIRNFLSEPVMWCRVSFFIYNKEGIKKCLAFTRPWSTFWSHQSSFMLQIPTYISVYIPTSYTTCV